MKFKQAGFAITWNNMSPSWQNQHNECVPSEDSDQPGIRPVWSESSLSAWRKLGSLATHLAHSDDSDQTGRMPRLIWVFAGRTLTLLVLSCCGSCVQKKQMEWQTVLTWIRLLLHDLSFLKLKIIAVLLRCNSDLTVQVELGHRSCWSGGVLHR